MSTIKRKAISLETKYKIIKVIEEKNDYEEVYRQFPDIKCHNISKIVKNKEKYVREYESVAAVDRKRLRKGKYPEVEAKLVDFIAKANANGIPIGSVLLKEKANEIAEKMNIKFTVNDSFIKRFKTRNSIKFDKIHGEAEGVPEMVTNEWITHKLPEMIKEFKPEDVFNADEFGLFWRLLPNKTYRIKGKKFESGKRSKERVSVLVCANMTGTEKLKLIVIGKAYEPRCFRGKSKVPVVYENNEKSWMTSIIFTRFMKQLDARMSKEKRKIALIVDNCPSHPPINLNNIKLIFLPPNTTSVLQPMDAGVIHSLRSKYRVKIARKLLALIDANKKPTEKNINLYEAIIMLKKSWDEVSAETIKNCFIKSGFSFEQNIETNEDNYDDLIGIECFEDGMEGISFEEFVNADNELATNEFNLTEDSINISSDNVNEINDESDAETIIDVEVADNDEEEVKLIDAMNAFSTIRKYLYQSGGEIENSLEMIDNIELDIIKRKSYVKQSKITDYFKTN